MRPSSRQRLIDAGGGLPVPARATATLIYALWPAGVAMSSVVGTDVPAAALLVLALALLAGAGAPATDLSAGDRVRRRDGAGGVGARGGAAAVGAGAGLLAGAPDQAVARGRVSPRIGVAATLVVLLPWGIRHVRQSGQLYFTDDHGGITALIGANPNSEGTYTRALNRMFKDVTGRSVLDEPHRETDRAAFAIAREWFAFEPRYALGLAVRRPTGCSIPNSGCCTGRCCVRACWSGPRAQWLAAHRARHHGRRRRFGFAVAALGLAGIAAAVARRRWPLLALLPFMLALVATYTLFFAEPRYRLPIEVLAFPFVALALAEIAGAAARRRAPLARGRGPRRAGAGAGAWCWSSSGGRVAGVDRLGRWAARAPPLGDLRGRARRAEAPVLWARQAPVAGCSPLAGAPEGVPVR